MIEEMQFPPEEDVHVVLAGSIFIKGEHPLLIDELKAKVNNNDPGRHITFKLLDVPNVAGSVIWALNTLDGKSEFYDIIRAQLK